MRTISQNGNVVSVIILGRPTIINAIIVIKAPNIPNRLAQYFLCSFLTKSVNLFSNVLTAPVLQLPM